MTQFGKFLIIGLGVILILAACGIAVPETEIGLTAENAESAEGKEEVVMATATSTSSVQAVSTNTPQDTLPTTKPASSPTNPPPDSPTGQPTAEQPPTPQLVKADFPNLGIAPEIKNEVWVNADEPVTLASQRGKVVLLEFWTFG